MRNLPKAEKLYSQSLKICENLFGHNDSMVAILLNKLGDLYSKIGKQTKAEEFFLKSLEIQKKNKTI